MFTDVDINGDGNMSWNEFVQYIVSQVQQQSLKPTIDDETGKLLSIRE